MRKLIRIILGLAFIVSSAFAEEARVVRFVYMDTDVSPYYRGTGREVPPQDPGLAVEGIIEIAKHLDISAQFLRAPFSRITSGLEKGDYDAFLGMAYRPGWNKDIRFPMKNGKIDSSKKLRSTTISLYTKIDSPISWDGKTLENLHSPVQVIHEHFADSLIAKNIPVEESPGPEERILQMIIAGRIEAAAASDINMAPLMLTEPYRSKVRRMKLPIATFDYYLAFSPAFVKRNPNLSSKLWESAARIYGHVQKARQNHYIDLFQQGTVPPSTQR